MSTTARTPAEPPTVDEVITAGRYTSLTAAVVAEFAGSATPQQRQHLHGLFTAEYASRKAARVSRLLKAARIPTVKTLEGYDWSQIRLPTGFDRDQLTGLDFLDDGGDLVFYGDVGTGKTHLASALAAQACRDAGEESIALRVEMCAKIMLMTLSAPMLRQMAQLIGELTA